MSDGRRGGAPRSPHGPSFSPPTTYDDEEATSAVAPEARRCETADGGHRCRQTAHHKTAAHPRSGDAAAAASALVSVVEAQPPLRLLPSCRPATPPCRSVVAEEAGAKAHHPNSNTLSVFAGLPDWRLNSRATTMRTTTPGGLTEDSVTAAQETLSGNYYSSNYLGDVVIFYLQLLLGEKLP